MNPLIPKIEARIRELVPELQELTFGCEVRYGSDEQEPQTVTIGNPYEVIETKSYKKVRNPWCLDDTSDLLEILGHPIQLAHVLQAIDKREKGIWQDGAYLYPDVCELIGKMWNLSKYFADQEEETKLFVGELLGITN